MKGTTALVLSLACGLVEAGGFIKTPITAQKKPAGGRLARRDAIEAALKNEEIMYSMELQLGTPGQKVVVQVDTGSAELWVDPQCATAAESQQALCADYGFYDPDSSSSAVGPADQTGGVAYGDGSNATFAYFEDTLTIGGASVTQQFGVAIESYDIYAGLIGLGPELDYGFEQDLPYSLPLNSLAAQGAISSRAFSLDLRGYEESEGAVIFGGLDKGKFYGELQKIPIVMSTEGKYRLTVEMTSAGQTLADGSSSNYTFTDGNVLLDSGATSCMLHEDLVVGILTDMDGAQTETGNYVAPCSLRDGPGSIDFGFGGKQVQVPYSSFVRDVQLESDASYCYVGLGLRGEGEQQILGDSFLRAAYVVFDWDNAEVHIGQAADCGSDIVEIGSGVSAVPSVSGCNKSSKPSATTSSGSATQTSSSGAGSTSTGRPGASGSGGGDGTSAAATRTVFGGSALAAAVVAMMFTAL